MIKVKPLQWHDMFAYSNGYEYTIEANEKKFVAKRSWNHKKSEGALFVSPQCDSIEEAKRFAESDYEQLIFNLLIT